MSKFIFSVFFFFALCLLPSSIYGCSCDYSDPAGAFNEAQMVFVGRVMGGTEKVTADYDGSQLSSTLVAGQVRFAVENAYKGKFAAEVIVNVSSNIGTSCGPYGLTSGETYVVYAYSGKNDKTKLYTGVCTRTGTISSEYAAEDLKFLRNLPRAGSGGSIRGRIWYDSRERSGGAARPLANIKITIRNITTKRTFPVVSDKDGNFSLERVPAGKYTVTPQLPANFYVEEPSHTINVADRGTADTGFEAYYTGSVAGKIVDKNGIGFENMFLQLESMVSDPQPKSVYGHGRGKQGDYIVDGVPPGKYRLYFELDHDDYNQKGDRYYYPGTFDPREAKTIEVRLGEQIKNIDFPLPADYQIRTVSGQVFNKNGTPAAKVEVLLLCPTGLAKNKLRIESSPTTVKTDAFGNFLIQGFTGETYWLEARGEFSEKAGRFEQKASPSQKIKLQDNLQNIKLVLSEDESRSCSDERNKPNF